MPFQPLFPGPHKTMKILQNLKDSNYHYCFNSDVKKIANLLKNKSKYQWRFCAPEQIPPFPPNPVVFKSNSNKFGIGVDERNRIGRIYKGRYTGLETFIDGKKLYSDKGFFMLTKKIETKTAIKPKLSKKEFFKKIDQYLKVEDIINIEKISKSKFSKLINLINKTNKDQFFKIQSSGWWVDNKELNKHGLHLLRVILHQRIYEKKINGNKKSKDFNFFMENGYLLKKYSQFNSKKIRIFLKKISNQSIPKINWKKVEFQHIKNDPQYSMHVDSFQNTFKVWMYPGNATKKNGPLHFIPKSHKLSFDKLKWLYDVSISSIGKIEPAFRLDKKYFKKFGVEKFALPIEKSNTILIANTVIFHHRGKAKEGMPRITYRMDGDNDGGVKRLNPFL